MKGLLNNKIISYEDLSYDELCDPRLVLLHELPKDLQEAPKLHQETQTKLDKTLADLPNLLNITYRLDEK